MDFDNLKSQVSNLTLYDIKAGFRKAQNAVMNYTDMEAKVREATNNEPWGASTTTMQEIANGTFNYAQLNEIMPMIYKRFTEKAAEEWRQIYKALQLLEFLVKNGSERVIDDARSHLSLLKMLRQFHYIDHNGKDQGINVRNRAKELADLLGDVERIRTERKKARSTRNKYSGVEGGAGIGGGGSSRYGASGNETASGRGYGGYSGGVYGDGGGFGGEANDFQESSSRRDRFEEYDEYEEGNTSTSRRKAEGTSTKRAAAAKPEPPKAKEPEVDLFDFGEEDIASAPAAPAATKISAGASSNTGGFQPATTDDDDFDDFQSAAPVTGGSKAAMSSPLASSNVMSSFIAPPPGNQGNSGANYSAFATTPSQIVANPTTAAPVRQVQSPGYQAVQPNYFGSVSAASGPTQQVAQPQQSHHRGPSISTQPSLSAKPTPKADPFASLAIGGVKKAAGAPKATLADLNKQKANAGLWGQSAPAQAQPQQSQDLI